MGGVAVGFVFASEFESSPALALPAGSSGPLAGHLLDPLSANLAAGATPTFTALATRAKDMLLLSFEFYNLQLDTGSTPARVVVVDSTQPAFLVVVHQAQNVGEEVLPYPNPPPSGWPGDPPYRGVLAGESWLAFSVSGPIDFTLPSLLRWSSLVPSLVPVAVPTSGASPVQPTATQTSIEVPWNLVLSPDATGTWHHSTTPVTHGKYTELWQTRLGKGTSEPPKVQPDVRAVWTPGYPSNPAPNPFPLSLQPQDRSDIVLLSSGGYSPTGLPVTGVPIQVDLLMLTALGASVDLEGVWEEPRVSSLVRWDHRTSTGRDSYVKTVHAGYLFPTGHRAVLTVITDREFWVDASGDVVANLVQRTYVNVAQQTVDYTGNADEPEGGRQNPLRSVTITTLATPPLDTDPIADPGIVVPGIALTNGSGGYQALFVRSAGLDVPFTHVATDTEGKKVHFSTGAIWVDESVLSSSTIASLVSAYEGIDPTRRTPDLGGQLLAFAPTTSTSIGKTAHHVVSYELDGVASLNTGVLPGYFPVMASATIHLPAAEAMTGTTLSPPTVVFDPDYLAGGFAPGLPEVYLDVTSGGPGLAFPGKNTGGSAQPNFAVRSVTRDSGPAGGDPHNLRQGTFDPTDFFPTGNGALLLGAIEIAQILESFISSGSGAKQQAPKITSTPVYPKNNKAKPPTAINTTLAWSPKVTGDPLGIFVPKKGSKLQIKARIHTPFADPSSTTFTVDVSLTKFELQLFGKAAPFIGVTFDKVTFKFGTGSKTVVQPKIQAVTFLGPLTFINSLEQLLTSLGGPSIDLSDGGITASYALPLPSIGVGVFALQNLKLGAGLTIPFDGTPVRARFSLCTRDDPFLLTISFFGGGGFFALAIGADGIESLEVSLEFGAGVALDFGVASGSVSIMAGIYFKLQTVPSPQVQLTGFLRVDGSVEILGIITLSIEIYLGFTYLDPGKAYGEATVTVSVKVLCFSTSVSLTYQKRFGGSGDPNFGQTLTQGDWSDYCGAFA